MWGKNCMLTRNTGQFELREKETWKSIQNTPAIVSQEWSNCTWTEHHQGSRLQARSRYASGKSCNRPSRWRVPVTSLGKGNCRIDTQIPRCAVCFSWSPSNTDFRIFAQTMTFQSPNIHNWIKSKIQPICSISFLCFTLGQSTSHHRYYSTSQRSLPCFQPTISRKLIGHNLATFKAVNLLTTMSFSQNTTIISIMKSCYMLRLQETVIRKTF
jgi:hypothetical protein